MGIHSNNNNKNNNRNSRRNSSKYNNGTTLHQVRGKKITKQTSPTTSTDVPPTSLSSKEGEDLRRLKNQIASREARKKKKAYISKVEQQVEELRKENEKLKKLAAFLQSQKNIM
eukprot:c48399_g1_i1.p1 GENE.c48399_g1_i1~~c48399_g1_i1.p1  ORF type:complete len:114 (-),score=2.56 c48399_g1_i1:14-355(-)